MEGDEVERRAGCAGGVVLATEAVVQEGGEVAVCGAAGRFAAADAGGREGAADAGDGVVVEGEEFGARAVPICEVRELGGFVCWRTGCLYN